MTDGGALRVFLVDDHEIVIHGMKEFIEAEEGLCVVGEAGSAEEALTKIATTEPDVAVLDVRLPDMSGIELCRVLSEEHSEVRCLMFSSNDNQEAMLQAIIAGASGYMLKDARLPDVVEAIRSIGAGQTLLDPTLTRMVLDRIRGGPAEESVLTPREMSILELVGEGLTNREIAERLFLAEQTVKNNVSVMLAKLGFKRRAQAAAYIASKKDI